MLSTSREQRNNLAKVMVICKISTLHAWPSLTLHADAKMKSFCIPICTYYDSYVSVMSSHGVC